MQQTFVPYHLAGVAIRPQPSRLVLAIGLWLILLGGFSPPTAQATSVKLVTVGQLVDGAELVFQGHVVGSSTTAQSEHGRRIHTKITFAVTEVIKGVYAEPTIVLSFLGGRSGNRELRVAGMEYPKPGEQGIYFVESLLRRQVHPLYGWSQGRLLLIPDMQGGARVYTSRGLPVIAVAGEHEGAAGYLATDGSAAGFVTSADASAQDAMDVVTFKARLRRLAR